MYDQEAKLQRPPPCYKTNIGKPKIKIGKDILYSSISTKLSIQLIKIGYTKFLT